MRRCFARVRWLRCAAWLCGRQTSVSGVVRGWSSSSPALIAEFLIQSRERKSNGRLAHFFFLCLGWRPSRERASQASPAFAPRLAQWQVQALNRKEQDIEALLEPVVRSQECEIWGIEFVAQGRHSRLRIYIEREEGVTVEDCERVSRQVSDVLDISDIIAGEYTLEVSSPGMDRILFKPEHYARSLGEEVDLRLHLAFDGSKHYIGVLAGFENDEAYLHVGTDEFVFPIENVQRARIVPRFD